MLHNPRRALAPLLCILTLLHAPALAQSGDAGPLRPYLSCEFTDGLKVKEVDRRDPDAEKFRTVQTAAGERRVSVVDGYSVMFAYEGAQHYFANVKVERSDAGEYERDKAAVADNIKHLPSFKNVKARMTYAGQTAFHGFEAHGAVREALDKGEVLAVYALFDDAERVITTVYFLNQGKRDRRFESLEAWRALRDRFLERYTACVEQAKGRKGSP